MSPHIFLNVVLFMLVCLGVMQIRYRNLDVRLSTTPMSKDSLLDERNGLIEPYKYKQYCVLPDVIKAPRFSNNRITLVLHLSHDRLDDSMIEQVNNWEGPISLSIVFPKEVLLLNSEVGCAIQKLLDLSNQSDAIRERLSAHFILEKSNVNDSCSDVAFVNLYNFSAADYCSMAEVKQGKSNKTNDKSLVDKISRYPVNVARNIARKHALTKYILIADMDHLFSKNFELKMRNLASELLEKDPKTVLVYRIFEVSNKIKKYPEDKKDLYRLYKSGDAREFHKTYGGHKIPKLEEWFRMPDDANDTTSVQFYRKYETHHWEPQFVSLPSIPFHDEGFFYSVRDNTVLRWEMCRMGYKFAIINDVFMYHRGIKSTKETSIVALVRKSVKNKAVASIKTFNSRMDQMYPKTKTACPTFRA